MRGQQGRERPPQRDAQALLSLWDSFIGRGINCKKSQGLSRRDRRDLDRGEAAPQNFSVGRTCWRGEKGGTGILVEFERAERNWKEVV